MPRAVYIACTGSRETPEEMLPWLESTAADIVRAGCHIVTGNAPGADQAWARGGNLIDPKMVTLCLPWDGFEPRAIHPQNVVVTIHPRTHSRHFLRAAATHPWWKGMPPGGQRLHARNAMILDGAALMLGYRTGSGGTESAFRIAKMLDVPAYDVSDHKVRRKVCDLIEGVRP